jgi:hypothetical protein
MHAEKRPGLIKHSKGYVNAMAKWSMRIEMQAMDIREHCPIVGKVHSTREIFDSSGDIFHWIREARTID